ncbi:MAG TPA: hypothetical protein VGH32_13215, partial [Pirellulales bacterium]
EAGVGQLFVGLSAGANEGGASLKILSIKDSVDQIAAAVSSGTKWIESAFSSIASSAGLRGIPDGAAVEVIESVLDVATPEIPWKALHHFFDSLLHSPQTQKGAAKPAAADHPSGTSSTAAPIDEAIAALLFGDDWAGEGAAARESLAGGFAEDFSNLASALVESAAHNERAAASGEFSQTSARQQLFEAMGSAALNHRQPGRAFDRTASSNRAASDQQEPMRHSFVADWLLPGAIAAVVSGQTTFVPSRESEKRGNRGSSRFLLRSRRDIKF